MIDVLHHWLAATVIPKPLTTAIAATHIPSPLKKLASLGTVRRTKPSPPASHAQPARTRRRDDRPVIAASIVSCRSMVDAALMRRTRDARSRDELAAAFRFLGSYYSRAGPLGAIIRPPGGKAKRGSDSAAVSAEEVDAYLPEVDEPERSPLQALRGTILEIVPDAEQVIRLADRASPPQPTVV